MAEHVAYSSGGEISYIDTGENTYDVVHKFTASGSHNFVLNRSVSGYYLIVGGGGSGGSRNGPQGGGGAGGLLTNWGSTAQTWSQGTYGVQVGEGGRVQEAGSGEGYPGGYSSFNSLTAFGGGQGGGWNDTRNGGAGGSGGGGAPAGNGGSGVSGQGNAGGVGQKGDIVGVSSDQRAAGGGGGAGGVGGNGQSYPLDSSNPGRSYGGSGGAGVYSDITGAGQWYAGGGGGGSMASDNPAYQAPGGSGVGGKGGGMINYGNYYPTAGAANTGSGGGGAGQGDKSMHGGAGGCGIVVLRYTVTRFYVTVSKNSGGSVSQSSQWVTSGDTFSATIKANTNYYISSVKYGGASQTITNAQEMIFSKSVTDTATLEVTFTLKPKVTTDPGVGGTITPVGSYVDWNVSKSYVIAANPGYAIISVKVDGVEQTLTSRLRHTVTVAPTADVKIEAEFAASGACVYSNFL